VNKYFPAVNLALVLTIALLITLTVKTWTHPPFPFKVDGSSLVGSPKNLNKLAVSKPGYNAGTLSQVVQGNVFRQEREPYVPPPPPPSAPPQAPKPALPPPNLTLKGVLMLAGTKIAILQGKYSTSEGGKITQKKVKKKGYSLGQVVGDFQLTEIDRTSVTLDDKKGRKIRLRLTKRPPDKVIHREGNSLFQKNKKYNASKFKATPVRRPPVRPSEKTKIKPASRPANKPAPTPRLRISGAANPPAASKIHISGR